jgi:hypothetical protein
MRPPLGEDGSVYQITESGAVNRFGAIPGGNLASGANRETDLWPLILGALTERAFPKVISDLVIQARCEGVPWKVIGRVLGRSTTSTQNKYGGGLGYQRVTELDEELRWMARHASDPSMQNRFCLLARRLSAPISSGPPRRRECPFIGHRPQTAWDSATSLVLGNLPSPRR